MGRRAFRATVLGVVILVVGCAGETSAERIDEQTLDNPGREAAERIRDGIDASAVSCDADSGSLPVGTVFECVATLEDDSTQTFEVEVTVGVVLGSEGSAGTFQDLEIRALGSSEGGETAVDVEEEPSDDNVTFEVEPAAVELIETEFAEVFGLGPIRAVCDAEQDLPIGATFQCTGSLASGASLDFSGEVVENGEITMFTPQVVERALAEELLLEEFATDASDTVDCGAPYRVVDEFDQVACFAEIAGISQVLLLTKPNDADIVDWTYSTADASRAAEHLIETNLADLVDLGPTDGVCEPNLQAGAEFGCIGILADGSEVEYLGFLGEDLDPFVTTNNVLDTDVAEPIFLDVVIAEYADLVPAPERVECGNGTMLLDQNQQMSCVVHSADTTHVFTGSFPDGTEGIASYDVVEADLATVAEVLVVHQLNSIGEPDLNPVCDIADDAPVGSAFTCQATLGDGSNLTFEGIVLEGQAINVFGLRTVVPASIELDLFDRLTEDFPATEFELDRISCGGELVLLPESRELRCVVIPAIGVPFYAITTLNEELNDFAYVVG